MRDDIGKFLQISIRLLQNGSEVWKVFDITSNIQAGLPSASQVKLVGSLVECETVTAYYKYFGGVEGKTTFTWFGKGECTNSATYKIAPDDVGSTIAVAISPEREDGVNGIPICFESDIIAGAKPIISDISISSAEAVEGQTIVIKYNYSGGIEGKTRVNWYLADADKDNWVQVAVDSKVYKPRLCDISKRIKIEATPASVRQIGELMSTILPFHIKAAPPTIRVLEITGLKLEQDQLLVLEKQYTGGIEGNSVIEWFKVHERTNTRILLTAGTNSKTYKLTYAEIGCIIEVCCTPVRNDGVVGTPMHAITQSPVIAAPPKCESLEVKGTFEENMLVEVNKKYFGGDEGASTLKWFRGNTDADMKVIPGIENQTHYTCTINDVGKLIKIEFTPIRSDGVKGTSVSYTSPALVKPARPFLTNLRLNIPIAIEGSVVTGFAEYNGGFEKQRNHKWIRLHGNENQEIVSQDESYILQREDVDCRIIYSAQPVRSDGEEGNWVYSEPSPIIVSKLPRITEVKLAGDVIEGCKITTALVYDKNVDAELSEFSWLRCAESSEVEVAKTKEYTIATQDIGCTIKLRIIPVQLGNIDIKGEEIHTVSAPVQAAPPVATAYSLTGKPEEGQMFKFNKTYYGGMEGKSTLVWKRVKGAIETVIATSLETYDITLEDVDCTVKAVYTPIRNDGVEGTTVETISTAIQPATPKITSLAIPGECTEDATLSAEYKYYGGVEGKSIKQWFRQDIDSKKQEQVALNVLQYTLTKEDIGKRIVFQYTPVRSDGVIGSDSTIVSDVIAPLPPTLLNVTLSGQGTVSSTLSIHAIYKGGFEGDSQVIWMKGPTQTGPFQQILGVSGKTYSPTCEDVSTYIFVRYIPVRIDGVKGKEEESAMLFIGISQELQNNIKEASYVVGSGDKCVNHVDTMTGEKRVFSMKNKQITLYQEKKKITTFDYVDYTVSIF